MALRLGQCSVSLPRSSNRTCGFAASGFPTDFAAGPRRRHRRRLRLALELVRKAPDRSRCCQAHRQSPRSSPSSQAHLKSGAFAPPALPGLDALTPLSDSRFGRHPHDDVEAEPSPARVSPDYPFLSSSLPCPIPRRTERVRMSMSSLSVLPSPSPGGSASGLNLSRPAQASFALRPAGSLAAQGGLCHEAPARPVTQPNRSSATGLIDNYPGGTFLH